jgi:hypothetical protein
MSRKDEAFSAPTLAGKATKIGGHPTFLAALAFAH